MLTDLDSPKAFVRALFTPTDNSLLESFFTFRYNSTTHIIQYAAKLTRSHGMNIGLDCFSPTLTRMVGQDLSALNKSCDWIKLMTYPRVFGPAGSPFEFRALSKWLQTKYNIVGTGTAPCGEATKIVDEASGLSLSTSGLNSESITHEIKRGRKAGISNLLAGIALVEVKDVHMPTLEQNKADLSACLDAGADGLVLSWDLWHIKPEYLNLIHEMWNK